MGWPQGEYYQVPGCAEESDWKCVQGVVPKYVHRLSCFWELSFSGP